MSQIVEHWSDDYNPLFRQPKAAFDNAIAIGELSEKNIGERYAGNWMYMYTNADGSDAFKNIISRQYKIVSNTIKQEETW